MTQNLLPSWLRIAGLLLILATHIGAAHAAEPAPAKTPSANAFEQLLDHYEQVRSSLIVDSTRDVAQNGREMLALLGGLEKEFTAARAGVDRTGLESTRELLPMMKKAAQALSNAEDLESARDAFYDLSKPLVRWRKASTSSEKPVVAYCAMSRRSWLQPVGELENPYHGQSMLHCGETVDG